LGQLVSRISAFTKHEDIRPAQNVAILKAAAYRRKFNIKTANKYREITGWGPIIGPYMAYLKTGELLKVDEVRPSILGGPVTEV